MGQGKFDMTSYNIAPSLLLMDADSPWHSDGTSIMKLATVYDGWYRLA